MNHLKPLLFFFLTLYAVVPLGLSTELVYSNISFIENQEAVLECPADSFQQGSQFLWKAPYDKDLPNHVKLEGNKLVFPNTSRNDTGVYKCTSPKNETFLISLEIKYLSLVVMQRPQLGKSDFGPSLSKKTQIICTANCFPPAHITWFGNGTMLRNTSVHTIITHISQYVSESVLLIHDLSGEIHGDYFCAAVNELGNSTAHLNDSSHPDNTVPTFWKIFCSVLGGAILTVGCCLCCCCFLRNRNIQSKNGNADINSQMTDVEEGIVVQEREVTAPKEM